MHPLHAPQGVHLRGQRVTVEFKRNPPGGGRSKCAPRPCAGRCPGEVLLRDLTPATRPSARAGDLATAVGRAPVDVAAKAEPRKASLRAAPRDKRRAERRGIQVHMGERRCSHFRTPNILLSTTSPSAPSSALAGEIG